MNRNRLGHADLPPEFSHPLIDRDKPLAFRLNGITIEGFVGDTVLSAALAAGIDIAGLHMGHPVALEREFAPPVVHTANMGRPDLAVPMALCPAAAGMDLATLGPRHSVSPLKRVSALFSGRPRSLECDFDAAWRWPGPWIDTGPIAKSIAADIVIIGGGVAGLSAAVTASHRGLRVVLVERSQQLGGVSRYFGKTEGEAAPDATIDRLVADISASPAVTILTGTEAFTIRDGKVRTIGVRVEGAVPVPEHRTITAPHIVLATGCAERLPIFPGNRLPGVARASEAWRLAAHHNVWPVGTSMVHTSVNVGYRMALLGAGAGRTVLRSTDPRPEPQTRFIEFCKAYGFRLGWGTTVGEAALSAQGGLTITERDVESTLTPHEPIVVDRLIVSGGWQPELGLWLGAGGEIAWTAANQGFEAHGAHDQVKLAGAVAGYKSLTGCVASGVAIVGTILDTTDPGVDDPQIDPIYESLDGPLTCTAPLSRAAAPAYLASSHALQALPAKAEKPSWRQAFIRAIQSDDSTSHKAQALTVPDIVGAGVAGILPADSAADFARERCVLPERLGPEITPVTLRWPTERVPAYLKGRFGHAALWTLVASLGRQFEPGCLIFSNSDESDPAAAIGVVLALNGTIHHVLIDRKAAENGRWVFIRDGATSHAAPLDHRLE